MKEKKSPQRMCVACRAMRDKRELIRIVRSPDGEIALDFTGKRNGRGAYVCPSRECIAKCRKTKIFNKTFSVNIDEEIYDKLIEELEVGDR
ncbi:MAG: RNase P modulator RnpM [Christensenellales bacterium]